MISPAVIAQAPAFRESFQTARPFKHVCIDDFFTQGAAEASLRDFPPFDREYARNEFGEYGGKAVVSGQTFSRVSFDIPGQEQRFARARALRDAEDRATQQIADNISRRLASYFVAGS